MGEQPLHLGSMENSDYLDLRIPEVISVRCTQENEPFFRRLCDAVARESCRLVPKVNGRKLKPEDFELIKDNKSTQRYTLESLGKLNAEYP